MAETKRCPFCGEEILSVAIKCKHCGEWLEKKEAEKEKKACPVCGEMVDADLEVCPCCDEPTGFNIKSEILHSAIADSPSGQISNTQSYERVKENEEVHDIPKQTVDHSSESQYLRGTASISVKVAFILIVIGYLIGITAVFYEAATSREQPIVFEIATWTESIGEIYLFACLGYVIKKMNIIFDETFTYTYIALFVVAGLKLVLLLSMSSHDDIMNPLVLIVTMASIMAGALMILSYTIYIKMSGIMIMINSILFFIFSLISRAYEIGNDHLAFWTVSLLFIYALVNIYTYYTIIIALTKKYTFASSQMDHIKYVVRSRILLRYILIGVFVIIGIILINKVFVNQVHNNKIGTIKVLLLLEFGIIMLYKNFCTSRAINKAKENIRNKGEKATI